MRKAISVLAALAMLTTVCNDDDPDSLGARKLGPPTSASRWLTAWAPLTSDRLRPARSCRGRSATGGPPTEVPISGQPFRAEWLPDGRIAFITLAQGIGAELQVIDGTKQAVLFSFRSGGASFTDFAIRSHTP